MTSRGTSGGSNTKSTVAYNAMTNYDHANEDSQLSSNCEDAPARERPAVSSFDFFCVASLAAALNNISIDKQLLFSTYSHFVFIIF
jgi:hypothetical protein